MDCGTATAGRLVTLDPSTPVNGSRPSGGLLELLVGTLIKFGVFAKCVYDQADEAQDGLRATAGQCTRLSQGQPGALQLLGGVEGHHALPGERLGSCQDLAGRPVLLMSGREVNGMQPASRNRQLLNVAQ